MDTECETGSKKTNQNQNHKENLRFLLLMAGLFLTGLFTVIALWVYHVSFQQLDPQSTNPYPLVFFVTSIFSALLFAAVTVQIVVNLLQWTAMNDALKQNEELFNLAERPVVGLVKFKLKTFDNGQTRIVAILRNYGRTTAKNVTAQVTLTFREIVSSPADRGTFVENLLETCPSEPNLGEDEIFTGGPSVMAVNTDLWGVSEFLLPATLNAWKHKEIAIFILLRVTYTGLKEKPAYHLNEYARFIAKKEWLSCGGKWNDAN